MSIRQITILGTGLIGGSFGLAVKKAGFRGKIVGCDRKEVLVKAKRKRAIDIDITDPIEACNGSDLVLLATPVGAIIDFIGKLAPHLPAGSLLTDVGSTKSGVVQAATTSFGKSVAQQFLAGHPMAGKESSGIEFAEAGLFRGATWFLTPDKEGDLQRKPASEFVGLLKRIGARIAVVDSVEHDQLCAWISHVPQMIATALASTLIDEHGEDPLLLETGGRALREMTRIAASPYSMWRDIAITNESSISEALLKLEQKLSHMRENLATRELEEEFEQAHRLANIRGKKPKNRRR
jgi:prephenate dehydrogenase